MSCFLSVLRKPKSSQVPQNLALPRVYAVDGITCDTGQWSDSPDGIKIKWKQKIETAHVLSVSDVNFSTIQSQFAFDDSNERVVRTEPVTPSSAKWVIRLSTAAPAWSHRTESRPFTSRLDSVVALAELLKQYLESEDSTVNGIWQIGYTDNYQVVMRGGAINSIYEQEGFVTEATNVADVWCNLLFAQGVALSAEQFRTISAGSEIMVDVVAYNELGESEVATSEVVQYTGPTVELWSYSKWLGGYDTWVAGEDGSRDGTATQEIELLHAFIDYTEVALPPVNVAKTTFDIYGILFRNDGFGMSFVNHIDFLNGLLLHYDIDGRFYAYVKPDGNHVINYKGKILPTFTFIIARNNAFYYLSTSDTDMFDSVSIGEEEIAEIVAIGNGNLPDGVGSPENWRTSAIEE